MKKLFRSKNDRMIAGVCGGLAQYFEIDPVIIRGVFTFLACVGGSGIALYIVLAIITPEEGDPDFVVAEENSKEKLPVSMVDLQSKRRVFAIAIIILGVLILLGNIFSFVWLTWKVIASCAIIALGLYIFTVNKK